MYSVAFYSGLTRSFDDPGKFNTWCLPHYLLSVKNFSDSLLIGTVLSVFRTMITTNQSAMKGGIKNE